MKDLLEKALDELMHEDNGVNPNSPIPVEQQLEKKRAEYKKQLELIPLKTRIEKAVQLIENEMTCTLPEEEREQILSELADAGEALSTNPEMVELGISQHTFDAFFAYAKTKLDANNFEDAAAIFTLLSVLGSGWFRHWFFLGVALQELKEHKGAIVAYERANAITEENPLISLFVAECFADLEDKQQAALYLQKAKMCIHGLPENPEWLRLINALESRIK